jgi:hypothetical protein
MLAKIYDKLSYETSGIRLNYFTLKISDKMITNDFELHKQVNQNRIGLFWVI